MRVYARPFGIDRLSREARVLYTAFSLFMLLGGATGAYFFVEDGHTWSGDGTRRYYLGDGVDGLAAGELGLAIPADEDSAGPALELPALPAVASHPLRVEKPVRQVIENLHFHLFSMPVCLLIVGHLFMMCGLSGRTKVTLLAIAAAATLVHLLTPPLVRLVSGRFAILMTPSALALCLSWLVLTVWPVWEMWRPVERSQAPMSDGS